ncbi:MAG TPA: hypothetical protein VFR68_15590 [Candidatus Dormibacteraeota bacterium]|nr:hypothetical protein [Candidatus Dormibacteraeota bacterium]
MRHAGRTRCPWCGARNYTIDIWCSRCSHYLDWAPPGHRYHRSLAVLSALAAVTGVSMFLALPLAGWAAGSRPTVSFSLPNLGLSPQANAALQPAATPTAERSTQPDASPSLEASPTPDIAPSPTPDIVPAPALAPSAAPPSPPPVTQNIGQPTDAVVNFYRAVSAHQFDVAASLWTQQLQQRDPPSLFIDQRFAATDRIDVAAARLLSTGAGIASVYVDVVEVIGGLNRRWIGTWQVVDTPSGWLLNNPNLRSGI